MKTENILIVSPSENFSKQTRLVMQELGREFQIIETSGEQYFEQIQEYIQRHKVYVIVTRGYNVQFLRERLTLPIVDVRYTFEDIYYSFQQARSLSENIAFISTDIIRDQTSAFQTITDNQMLIPTINTLNDIPKKVEELFNQGIDVFIGGKATEDVAKRLGAHSIDILVEPGSIKTALSEAMHLVQLDKEKQKNQSFISAILEATDTGMIAISMDKKINYINKKAKLFLENDLEAFIETTLVEKINEAAETNDNLINQLLTVNHQNLIFNLSPIMIESETIGFLASFEKLDELQVKEGDVRTKLSTKITVARRTFDSLIGSSPELLAVIKMAKRYAETESVVLINGESGTGKELFAQSIHNRSPRRNGPFIAINCASLSENILESELFGYVKGAFTGAMTEGKAGLFEAAHKGTIFLDEIGEVSLNFQAKLLRVLQEKEITRIGDTKSIPVDVRIISATNRQLISMVEEGDFREDLYYRLAVLQLTIPPLRDRATDINELVLYFLGRSKKPLKISSSAIQLLSTYEFPGNIRQLENITERLVVLSESATIDDELVRDILNNEPRLKKVIPANEATSIPENEKELIARTLIRFNNNKTLTAKELKISKSTLWRKIKRYHLE